MYKKKKKINKRKIVLISLIFVCLILGFIANVINTNRNLTVFEKAIKDGILSIEKVISYPIDFVIKKINITKEKNKMYEDYKILQKKVIEIDNVNNKNLELIKELEEMKKILELNNVLSEHLLLNATIINRDLGFFYDTVIIDKGQNSGVTKNMPVVVKEGLIGKVIKTTTFTSTVRLLTANNSNDQISVKIKNGEEYAYGILSNYNKEKDTYIISGIAQNVDIKNGSVVTTTGMGDIFPSGIVIGKVKGITTDSFDLAKVLEIESDVNFNNLNYVAVLKRNNIK
ncbi:MAG: rod shape-determining protein MreC [Bacilli bacterium]